MSLKQRPNLLGYSERLSARPGDQVEIKVSSSMEGFYTAELVRIISADPNPRGLGIIERPVPADFSGSYLARFQDFTRGSYIRVELPKKTSFPASFSITANIWATLPGLTPQAIVCVSNENGMYCILGINEEARLIAQLRLRDGSWSKVELRSKVSQRQWTKIWTSYDSSNQVLTLGSNVGQQICEETIVVSQPSTMEDTEKIIILIAAAEEFNVRKWNFNGKIERPSIFSHPDIIENIGNRKNDLSGLFASWDFSLGIPTTRIDDIGPYSFHGTVVNFPARAMTGSNWNGSEMCWRHAPEQYGAIHFHDDDIYDFDWETDFVFDVPINLRSGLYGVRLIQGTNSDVIPIFICPPKGQQNASLCLIASTFTYTVYGNHARPDYDPSWQKKIEDWGAYPWNPAEFTEYGLSTYNYHSDGSGICHASYRRPLFTLRSGYLTFCNSSCSGLRHLAADTHLIAWLENQGYEYDVVTDQELHDDGVDLLAPYKTVMTGTHPEYHTKEMLDAVQQYRDNCGRLIYLGGNGFYWRIVLNSENPSLIEVRRGEGGIRAWAAETGEYYSAFDGSYGGLWRRNGRPPQQIAGIGFSAQGTFSGSYYRRTPASYADDVKWIFDGIDEEIIGNFGFSGGGAAGFELDRADSRLGSPENLIILASSESHDDTFVLVPEEQLTHLTTWPGKKAEELIRADMIYADLPGGGAIFSTGSITFCGSLPSNNFNNNVSRLLVNVLERFLRA